MKIFSIILSLFISQAVFSQERMTSFDPKVHGFNFVNSFTNDFIKEFDVKTGGLCGGMVYAALDYYLAGKTVPQQNFRPTVHTELHDYLYDRQLNSLTDNLDKWIELGFNPLGARNSEFFNWGLQGFNGGRIEELRRKIDAGMPVPLGLWHYDGALIADHQVLAIGYKMGRYKGDLGNYKEDFAIYIYDPNIPNKTQTLKADVKTGSFYYLDNNYRWLTYFVDNKYRASTPPNVAEAAVVNDGKIRQLRFEIMTGGDDLRGGNDNLNILVNYAGKPSQLFKNVNNSRRWIDNYRQTFELTLNQAVSKNDFTSIVLKTNFSGGFGSENWKMDRLVISAIVNDNSQVLFNKSGKPLYRFTGQNKSYSANINYVAATQMNARYSVAINRCHAALQGKVAWDYKGNKAWGKGNLDKMCKLNNQTDQPAKCFQKVMHGNVNWGGGDKWQWQNVLNLCQGTLNANRTIICFKNKIQSGKNWSTATNECKL